MPGKSSNWESSGHTQIVDHLHGLLMHRKREYWGQSRRRWLEVAGLKEPLKNNNSKRLSGFRIRSLCQTQAKHDLIPRRLHHSTRFTGTPYSDHWPYTTLRLEARTHSRLLFFPFSREIGADLHLHNRRYLFGFDGKADGDKGGAREGQRNPGNVVSVAGIKTADVIISLPVARCAPEYLDAGLRHFLIAYTYVHEFKGSQPL